MTEQQQTQGGEPAETTSQNTTQQATGGGGTPLPAPLAERYKAQGWTTIEQLEQGYASLRQQASQPKGQEPQPGQQPPVPSLDAPPVGTLVQQVMQRAAQTGSVSDDDRKLLKGAGFTDEIIASTEAGVRAQGELYRRAISDALGGDAGMQEAVAWGQANLDQATRDRLNAAFQSGNPGLAQAAAQELLTLKNGATGVRAMNGNSRAANLPTGVKPFGSQDEWIQAINDPRYQSDAAYRAEVSLRRRHSDIGWGETSYGAGSTKSAAKR